MMRTTRILFVTALMSLAVLAEAAAIPRDCLKYRRELVGNARQIFGLNAPVSTFAAQMRQESSCNPAARSAYAEGLTQFTPDTVNWIGGMFPELAAREPLNPTWAIRAMVRYDKYLVDRANGQTDCDNMWFALWGYNGGEGWVRRDKKLALAKGANPRRYESVAPFNAGRAPAMFAENRHYPIAIVRRWQPMFVDAGWGNGSCS